MSEQAAASSDIRLHPKNHGFTWNPVRGPFRIVSEDQAQAFNDDGCFVLRDAIDRETLSRVTGEIDPWEVKFEEQLRAHGGKMFIAQADGITFTVHLVKRSRILREFAASRLFSDLCHDLIGLDARLYWDQAVYKKPEFPKDFPWHQDNGYTYVEPQNYLTCWIPLTDASVDNGCPWVVRGGHRFGTLEHKLSDMGWFCREHDGAEAFPVPVKAGDVVVFSSLTPHRTGPNVTKNVRKTYILQYAPDGARVVDGEPCSAPDRQFLILKNGESVAPPEMEKSS